MFISLFLNATNSAYSPLRPRSKVCIVAASPFPYCTHTYHLSHGGCTIQGTTNVFDAMQWCRNQQVWVRLLIQGKARMLCEVVTMYGTLESMSSQALYPVMVQMCWQLKPRACGNMQCGGIARTSGSCTILTGRRLWWSPLRVGVGWCLPRQAGLMIVFMCGLRDSLSFVPTAGSCLK